MVSDYTPIVAPIISLLVNIFVHITIFRLRFCGLLISLYWGFALGFVSLLSIEFCFLSTAEKFLPILITNVTIYISMGYCYFHFVNLGETGRRIRLIKELYNFQNGLSMEEILERYNSKNIVEMRIKRLIKNDQILYKNGKYFIGNPTLLTISKIITTMKLIILGAKSEHNL